MRVVNCTCEIEGGRDPHNGRGPVSKNLVKFLTLECGETFEFWIQTCAMYGSSGLCSGAKVPNLKHPSGGGLGPRSLSALDS